MFRHVCEMYNIKIADIWNVDETGFLIGMGKDEWVLTRDIERSSYLGSSSNRELVTVRGCQWWWLFYPANGYFPRKSASRAPC